LFSSRAGLVAFDDFEAKDSPRQQHSKANGIGTANYADSHRLNPQPPASMQIHAIHGSSDIKHTFVKTIMNNPG
jgi:hypothetical protein